MPLEEYYMIETAILRKQSFAEYYQTLDVLAEALDGNELYNANRPTHLPTGEKFREHKSAMKEYGIGADRGDLFLKEKRQARRDDTDLDIDAAVCYTRSIAINKKDPTILHTLKLPLKDNHQKNLRKAPPPQAVEIHLEVKHVKGVPGVIVIMGNHVRNGGPYLLNLCKGEPTSEESWYNPGGHYNSCRRIELKGLEPANKYYVRMRTDRSDGLGEWSQPASIIVL